MAGPSKYFSLSSVDLDVKNYLKGDVHDAFSQGRLKDERLLWKEVVHEFQASITVDHVLPMHVFQLPALDTLDARLLGAWLMARMIATSGRKSLR